METLIIYLAILAAIGLFDWRRSKDWDGYVLAGRDKSATVVTLSILASVVGASSTMGVISLAYSVGFPAFWWLGAGAVGLILQGALLSGRVRSLGTSTLPDLAERVAGPWMRKVAAVVVAVGWTGIVAAQFVAAAEIGVAMSGFDALTMTLATAAVITGYAVLGGQHSVIRTDMIQFGFLAGGLLWLLFTIVTDTPVPPETFTPVMLNELFTSAHLMEFLLVVGGSYFICPIIFSRLFTAKDEQAARRASHAAGILLIPIALLITAIGLWAGQTMPGIEGNILTTIANTHLSGVAAPIFFLAILSAIVSSADTCLLAVGSIVSLDLMGSRSVKTVRAIVVLTGLAATGVALKRQDIIDILLQAYSIFTAGLVPPLSAGLLGRGRFSPNHSMLLAGAILGGTMALIGSATETSWISLAGLGGSTILSVAACFATARSSAFSTK
ncbi:sodium:solute symporter family protein [Salidesulfovibrio brasiliensis]|uniref:sodium:solute symporter family protein n=1 Tax=Salidesulfovibrio brasiliensis TaxID=221711 RepID=UPI0006D0208F|nr:sodium:solute symporter family protein [Salidesulfovibrio brasiliensis]